MHNYVCHVHSCVKEQYVPSYSTLSDEHEQQLHKLDMAQCELALQVWRNVVELQFHMLGWVASQCHISSICLETWEAERRLTAREIWSWLDHERTSSMCASYSKSVFITEYTRVYACIHIDQCAPKALALIEQILREPWKLASIYRGHDYGMYNIVCVGVSVYSWLSIDLHLNLVPRLSPWLCEWKIKIQVLKSLQGPRNEAILVIIKIRT